MQSQITYKTEYIEYCHMFPSKQKRKVFFLIKYSQMLMYTKDMVPRKNNTEMLLRKDFFSVSSFVA